MFSIPSNKSNSSVQIHSIINRLSFQFSNLIIAYSTTVASLVYVSFNYTAEAPELEKMSFTISFSREEFEESWNLLLAVPTAEGILDGEVRADSRVRGSIAN
jgi:hypothetical protein